jgi:hypothetical protein
MCSCVLPYIFNGKMNTFWQDKKKKKKKEEEEQTIDLMIIV